MLGRAQCRETLFRDGSSDIGRCLDTAPTGVLGCGTAKLGRPWSLAGVARDARPGTRVSCWRRPGCGIARPRRQLRVGPARSVPLPRQTRLGATGAARRIEWGLIRPRAGPNIALFDDGRPGASRGYPDQLADSRGSLTCGIDSSSRLGWSVGGAAGEGEARRGPDDDVGLAAASSSSHDLGTLRLVAPARVLTDRVFVVACCQELAQRR
jgi:hypothetical protein